MTARYLLGWLLILTVGLALTTLALPALMDVVSIVFSGGTDASLSVGFVDGALGLWPGGHIVRAVMKLAPLTPAGIVADLVGVVVIAFIKFLLPIGALEIKQYRIVKYGLIDMTVTWILGLGWIWALGNYVKPLFESTVGKIALWPISTGILVLIGLALWKAMQSPNLSPRRLVPGADVPFRFTMALGKFFLGLFVLIVWGVNGTAGGVTMFLAILACGAITVVEAGERERSAWRRR